MEAIYRTNVFAMAYTFHGFIEPMTKRGRGKLVGIASVSGIRGFPGSRSLRRHPSPPSSPTTKAFASASGRRASRSRTISPAL